MTDRDIDLVLITGAGASCAFGNSNTGGSPTLPLMAEWSDILVRELRKGINTLEALVGLEQGLDGPEFEKRLGEFLTLASYFPNTTRLVELPPTAHVAADTRADELRKWHSSIQGAMISAVNVIHQSLVDNFGWDRIDGYAAREAYTRLFQFIGMSGSSKMVYATTNYDYLGELALDEMGRRPDNGIRRKVTEPGVYGPAVIDVENLVETVGRLPVLHLHGGVGWYEKEGQGPTIVGQKHHDSAWGVPLVMLPSTSKSYKDNSTIQATWQEFHKALRRARLVVVLGHSLNDSALLSALMQEIETFGQVVISVLDASKLEVSIEAAQAQLSGCHLWEKRFDRNVAFSVDERRMWREWTAQFHE